MTLTIFLGMVEKIKHSLTGQNTRVYRRRKVGIRHHGTFIFAGVSEFTGHATSLLGSLRRLEKLSGARTERCWPDESIRGGGQQDEGAERKVGNHFLPTRVGYQNR